MDLLSVNKESDLLSFDKGMHKNRVTDTQRIIREREIEAAKGLMRKKNTFEANGDSTPNRWRLSTKTTNSIV